MKNLYHFFVHYFDVPTQKYKGRYYVRELDCCIEDTAKCFISLFKTTPGVRDVTLQVYDINDNLIIEV